jgi:hypothetical protein
MWCRSPGTGDAMLRVTEGVDDWPRRLQGTTACAEYIESKLRRRDLTRDVLTTLLGQAVATGRFRTWPAIGDQITPELACMIETRGPDYHRADADEFAAMLDAAVMDTWYYFGRVPGFETETGESGPLPERLCEHWERWAAGKKKRKAEFQTEAFKSFRVGPKSKAFKDAWQLLKLRSADLTFGRGEKPPR